MIEGRSKLRPRCSIWVPVPEPGPDNVLQRLQARYTPPTGVSTGTSLCLNKRLCSSKTQHLVGWSPRRTDILTEIESRSYTNRS
jgi:hypothetical protein